MRLRPLCTAASAVAPQGRSVAVKGLSLRVYTVISNHSGSLACASTPPASVSLCLLCVLCVLRNLRFPFWQSFSVVLCVSLGGAL